MNDLYHPESRVVLQHFADGAVLYLPSNETYHGLNETGARIWSLMPSEGIGFEQLLGTVCAAYPEVPADDLRADLTAWLSEVVAMGLVRRDAAVAA